MTRQQARGLAVVLVGLLPAATAAAHGNSSSYLTVAVEGRILQVQWEIALRDLDYAIGLDSRGDGVITWGVLRDHAAAISAYAMPRLQLSADGASCVANAPTLLADRRGDGAYAVLRFAAACPAAIRKVGVHYALLFDLDPMHRGLLHVAAGRATQVTALSPDAPDASIDIGGGLLPAFGAFFRIGIAHIFSGLDHMLFVAVLLLPAAFRSGSGACVVQRTVGALGCFTLAHAVTVTAVALGLIDLPARQIEGAIALTIVVTAVDNIVPILPSRRDLLAFGFGLIHGLGFAAALGPLSLPPLAAVTALVAFNLGVEAAQLAVATAVLPVGFALRRMRMVPARLLPGASAAIAVLALTWFVDRAFNITWRSF